MVDPVVNKGKVTVSTGYNSTATSIVLATGQGSELPDPVVDGAYNLPWWDSTNYDDPADDPNFEIVRVTGPAGTGDTKTIVRAQEGTAATNKNNADATYKMHLGVTAKTITDITDTLQINPITNEVGIGIAPVSGARLTLPSEDDAITPSLAFGDGDTGFYENADDTLALSIATSTKWFWIGNNFLGWNSGAAGMANIDSTDTVPNVFPNKDDLNTGIGSAASDQLSLIAGGIEGHRITKSGGRITHTLTEMLVLPPSGNIPITAAGGITVTHTNMKVYGDGGAIDITADPQIAAGVDGQIVILTGENAINTLTLDDGTGLKLSAQIVLAKSDNITLIYDAGEGYWYELSRTILV